MIGGRRILLWFLIMSSVSPSPYFVPFNVSYDHRALILGGKRRILNSAGIHYPRATPEMWPDLIAKSKQGGAEVVQTYVFWDKHEPVRGQYYFEGRFDIVKFVKNVAEAGLYLHLRIGPYICAEWNFGGFPVWLRDIPGIIFRTDNEPYKEEMKRFVTKIVDLMREQMLFSWQGGPIIMLQIENEYGNIESSYGQAGKNYVKWAANMALGLGAGVPWVMCQQADAPGSIINACNGYYCDGFRPNSGNKPTLWTEDWDGWFASWGGKLPHRPVEDLAFAVARFFQRGGSFQNYYMYFGGTNFGRTSGGPFYVTSYDYDAPLDEFGLKSQPKWGHLKDLHAAIKLCEMALVSSDSAHYIKLGPAQEAHIYNGTEGQCAAFVANIDEHSPSTVHFLGKVYTIPPWSVSILPDCRNVVFNSAKVAAQTSIKSTEVLYSNLSPGHTIMMRSGSSYFSKSWKSVIEPVALWSNDTFTSHGILEHLNVTKDRSDYLWYFTRIHVSPDDVAFWEENEVIPKIEIDSMRDVFRAFVNGQLAGSVVGHGVKVVQPIKLVQGYNDLVLMSQTVGLQNYGAFLERDGAGFRGNLKLTGFKDGDLDLSKLSWTYQVGLCGEFQKIYSVEENEKAEWTDLVADDTSTFTWYKTYFDSPEGHDPVALNFGSMGKGQAWVNGHHIGRYWNSVSPKDGCQKCDYRGPYYSDKCTTNCGKPTQIWYHVPRSWLQASNNLLVLFEEIGGKPTDISVDLHSYDIVCGHMSETHYPPVQKWSQSGTISIDDPTPEMHLNCEEGHVIGSIEFASYGTPNGDCPSFQRSSCHAVDSEHIVKEACEGRSNCSIKISNAQFGGDPCRGIVKTLAVQARCISSAYKLGASAFK